MRISTVSTTPTALVVIGLAITNQIGTLARGAAGSADTRGHDHLRAEEPGGRILELAHVRPGHPPRHAPLPGDQAQLQCGGAQEVLGPDHAVVRYDLTVGCAADQRQDRGLWRALLRPGAALGYA